MNDLKATSVLQNLYKNSTREGQVSRERDINNRNRVTDKMFHVRVGWVAAFGTGYDEVRRSCQESIEL